MASTEVEAPKGIYHGKFTDRCPELITAGKLTTTGDDILVTMKPKPHGRTSPEPVRRLRAQLDPVAGAPRVHYGRAYDPQRTWAAEMTHGKLVEPSGTAKEQCNPAPKSRFQQRILDQKEAHYWTNKHWPLGVVPMGPGGLPKNVNPIADTFGIKTYKDAYAGESLNPPVNHATLEREEAETHDLYRNTHRNFYPGEQLRRNYTQPSFDTSKKYGKPTPHFNDGRLAKQTTHWLTESQREKGDKIVSKRLEDFREKTQPQLGKVHDPIKDTLKVGLDHTFGILQKPDEYGAGDLIHSRCPAEYLRGKDRIRGVVSAVRQHLKKVNYQNFDHLIAAFKHYDKDNKGYIALSDLQRVCEQFSLPADSTLLHYVMNYCDTNGSGCIDYCAFVNFLNWQDKMPSGLPSIDDRGQSAPISTPRLTNQVDPRHATWDTSASMINATVGGVSNKDYRTYGVPTIRWDVAAPKFRRVSDRVNYGDEGDAYALLNPHVFAERGLSERDFLQPRSREQLRDIFEKVGLRLTRDEFDALYDEAARLHPRSEVSVEALRHTLDTRQVKAQPAAFH